MSKYSFQNIKPEKVFLYISLCWGLLMVFLVPPFQVPDEPAHFYRAYQIANFTFLPELENNMLGGNLPKSLLTLQKNSIGLSGKTEEKFDFEIWKSCLKIPLHKNERRFLTFPNTSLYSPVPYIPQSLGIFTGGLFQLPPLILLYFGRIFNLLVWVALFYWAIKIIPVKKWLFLVLALIPMSVHIAASVSADAFLNGLSFLLIAYILKLAYNDYTNLGIKELIILLVISVLIALSKNIYIILVLLFFIIPSKKTGNYKNYLLKCIILLGTVFLIFVLSSLLVNWYINQIDPIENFYGTNSTVPKINPSKQVQIILADIPGFFNVVINSFTFYWQMVAGSYIGYLGWMELSLGNYFYLYAYLTILFLAITDEQNKIKIRLFDKAVFLTVFLTIIVAFSFTMYCSWTEPGSKIITNLQGRYFIPVAPLGLLVFANNRFISPGKIQATVVLAFILVSIIVSTGTMLNRFY